MAPLPWILLDNGGLCCSHGSHEQAHFQQIVPEAEVEAVTTMFSRDTADSLLAGSPSYVLDAIDNLDTKVCSCKQSLLARAQPGMITWRLLQDV